MAPHTPDSVICEKDKRMSVSCITPQLAMHCRLEEFQSNRNYTASVIAINSAGESEPLPLTTDCMTQYNKPDKIEAPVMRLVNDTIQVQLAQPDSDNGPITCYYLVIIACRSDIDSINDVQATETSRFRFANFNGTIGETDQLHYTAYVAESYKNLPTEELVLIGDGKNTGEMCSTDIIGGYPPSDVSLSQDYTYFGFLVASVEVESWMAMGGPKRKTEFPMNTILGYSSISEPVTFGEGKARNISSAS